MTKIETVVFDVGNVLLRWTPGQVAAELLPEASEEQRRQVAALASTPLWKAYDRGLTPDEAAARVEDEALRPLAARFIRDFAAHMPLVPHGVDLLRRLRAGGHHRLVVLSNFPAAPFADAERLHPEVFGAFSGFTVSGRVGVTKPGGDIYRRLLADHGLRAEACVFIDDRPENCEAAREHGLRAVLYDDADPARVERELAALGVRLDPEQQR